MNSSIILQSLSLKNFATFKDEIINFSNGFNVVIGETGSGKSLIFDALQFIFGHRADKKFIRKKEDFSIIEALFQSNDEEIKKYLVDLGYPYEGDIISIKRILYQNSTSKAYLNFQLVPLQVIQKLSKRFVDFAGQFENQKILSNEYQLRLLDKYSFCEEEVKDYQKYYKKIQEHKQLLEELNDKSQNRNQRIDYINFQVQEIEKINPSLDREKNLLEKKEKLKRYRNFHHTMLTLNDMLSEGEQAILGKLSTIKTTIQENNGIFSNEVIEKVKVILSSVEDLSFEISRQSGEMVWDEGEFEAILNELSSYQKLKRKWGGSVEDILVSCQALQNEREELNNISKKIAEIEGALKELTIEATHLAEALHSKREEKASLLSKELSLKVRKLNMEYASIDLQCLKSDKLFSDGLTILSFLVQTNLGEDFSEVKKIASGGELSRIFLALRQVLSSKDSVSIFFFDEIASGIGGQTALTVGQALKEVSFTSQVIAITHLPQIAILSDKLLSVQKQVQASRTYSLVTEQVGEDIKMSVQKMSPTI